MVADTVTTVQLSRGQLGGDSIVSIPTDGLAAVCAKVNIALFAHSDRFWTQILFGSDMVVNHPLKLITGEHAAIGLNGAEQTNV